MTEALSLKEIHGEIGDLKGWSTDGRKIECSYSTPHIQGAALVMHIAAKQDGYGHHSDATLGFKTVHLSISSSDIGGYVAAHDIELARRIHAISAATERCNVAEDKPGRAGDHSRRRALRFESPLGRVEILNSAMARISEG